MAWGGPYVQTSWVNGTTPLSAAHMGNLETQYQLATQTFEQDLFGPFVLFGLIATADAVTVNQLDVTSGVAFLIQTDSTVARQSIASSAGPLTTSALSSTYFLDLNPNGTYSFATSHSGTANYLPIAQVTTNGSGNIATVTDKRDLNATVFPNMAGGFAVGNPIVGGGGWAIDALGTSEVIEAAISGTITAAVVSGTGLGIGAYRYVVTYLSYLGESIASSITSCTTTTGNQKVNLTTIPTGPAGVLKRNLYRSAVGGTTLKLLTTLADNTTTTYSDTTADGSLGSQNPPTHQTIGGSFWKSNGAGTAAAIYPDGAIYFDNGGITSTGSGFLTITGGLNVTNGLGSFYTNTAGSTWAFVFGQALVGPTLNQGYVFQVSTSNVTVNALSLGATNPGAALVNIDNLGDITASGALALGQSSTSPVLATNGTISTATLGVSRVNPSGAVTGVILQAGTVPGQHVVVVNESGSTITFAASGTSHVADGVSDVIAALTSRQFVWDNGTSLWYHSA